MIPQETAGWLIIGILREDEISGRASRVEKKPIEGRYNRCSNAISRGRIEDSMERVMKNQRIQKARKGRRLIAKRLPPRRPPISSSEGRVVPGEKSEVDGSTSWRSASREGKGRRS